MDASCYRLASEPAWSPNLDRELDVVEVEKFTLLDVTDGPQPRERVLIAPKNTSHYGVAISRLYTILKKSAQTEHVALWALLSAGNLLPKLNVLLGDNAEAGMASQSIRLSAFSALDVIETNSRLLKDDGTVAPSVDAVLIARKIIELLPTDIPSPYISASDDGDIAFFWTKGGNKVEALLDSDHVLAWVAKIPPARSSDAEDWSGEIQLSLLDWLRKLST